MSTSSVDRVELPDSFFLASAEEFLAPPPPPPPYRDPRLHKVDAFLRRAGLAPGEMERCLEVSSTWTIGDSGKGKEKYVTSTGESLKSIKDVATFLKLDLRATKTADLINFLESMGCGEHADMWRVERRIADGNKNNGWKYVSMWRTCYSKERVGVFVAAQRLRRNVSFEEFQKEYRDDPSEVVSENGDDDLEADDDEIMDGSSVEFAVDNALPHSLVPMLEIKAKEKPPTSFPQWTVGDAVVVDYEGAQYDAVILAVENNRQFYNVLYVDVRRMDNHVPCARIIRTRNSTPLDVALFEKFSNAKISGSLPKRRSSSPPLPLRRLPPPPPPPISPPPPPIPPQAVESLYSAPTSSSSLVRGNKRMELLLRDDEERMTEKERRKIDRSNGNVGSKNVSDLHAMKEPDASNEFVNRVRLRIEFERPVLYKAFLSAMGGVHNGSIFAQRAMYFMIDNFGLNDTDLVLSFNRFVGEEAQVNPRSIRARLANYPNSHLIVCEPMANTPEEFFAIVKQRLSAVDSNVYSMFYECVLEYRDENVAFATFVEQVRGILVGFPDLVFEFNRLAE